jgi:crotonobetainyl-CoA:carnitine CoA-transferase CaiB-like acyl-CoA transferase
LTGPLKDRPSFDIVTQALTGVLSVNGEQDRPPVKLGLPLGDMVGGIFGPIAILSALHERSLTGHGRLIDVSLYDGLIGMLGYFAQLGFITGKNPQPTGSAHPNIVPYGRFQAFNGSIVIAALSDAFWFKLCDALDQPQLAEDLRLKTVLGRREHREEVDQSVAKIIAQRTVGEWEKRLSAYDVPHAPVLGVLEALAHPQALAREMVVTADHSTAGTIRMTGRPIKFDGARQPPLMPPPVLGEHTTTVLRQLLGYSDDDIERLLHDGVINRVGT